MHPVLAKHNPQWFAEIKEVDESIFVGNELFRKSRAELQELRDRMQQMVPEIQQSNNAVARYRFTEQWQVLETWQQWLNWHLSFYSCEGYKLLDWIKQRNGDVPVTTFLLDQAYARLKEPEPVPEPKLPPRIVQQPVDVSVEPAELAIFEVVAEGSQPLSYEWSINAMLIPGEATKRPRYSTLCTERTDGALFKVRVSNPYGVIFSWPALLTMRK